MHRPRQAVHTNNLIPPKALTRRVIMTDAIMGQFEVAHWTDCHVSADVACADVALSDWHLLSQCRNRHACDVAARLDQGYKLYILDVFLKFTPGAVPVVEPEEPFVIFVGIKHFPHPFWIERRNKTEAEVMQRALKTHSTPPL